MSKTPNVPLDDAHLTKYAANVARQLQPRGLCRTRTLVSDIQRDLATVRRAHQVLSMWSMERSTLPSGVEWLLDNHYLALREGTQAIAGIRGGRAIRGTKQGEALVLGCAKGALWAVPDLHPERVKIYLQGFQSVQPLTERELSLLVPLFSGALVARLASFCTQVEQLQADQIPGGEFERIFDCFGKISAVNWGAVLEQVSQLEAILLQDPSGHCANMDEDTRRRYRQQISRLARRRRMEEVEVAQRALELAQQGQGAQRHIGWYLFRAPLGQEKPPRSGWGYGGAIVLLSLIPAIVLGWLLGGAWIALLLVFPLSELVKNCLDFLLVHLVAPRPIPRMELKDGIPPEGRTLCVIVSLLTGPDSGGTLAALLERYRLANRDSGGQLRLGILADLPDSGEPVGEERAAWIEQARQAVEGLNEKYGGGFYLFSRLPVFSPRDERYMGWERKRGALTELVRLLKGRQSGVIVSAGESGWLEQTRYVITLDGDTSLNVGTAREMVGAMLHPLNQPVIDGKRRVVVAGHALLQPRIAVELEAANRSFFSRVYGGLGGIDPYGSSASDVYHDLFDQGTYTGKGIFQVDAFYTCLERRFPDNTILSHDLLEGSYLRAGLLGEVELTDGCPHQVHAYFARLHRWVRGDWQVLPWLGGRVPDGRGGRERNPLSPLARWKIADNLRRSLAPASTLGALMLGICFSGAVFAAAGAVAVLSAASNLLLSSAELAARRRNGKHRRYHSTVIAGLAGTILQTAVQLLLLPYHGYITLSAICTALWRMHVTKRNLLAWITAAQTEKGKGSVWFYYKKAWFSLFVGLVTVALAQLRLGMVVGLLWMAAPGLAWWFSRSSRTQRELSPADRAFLLHQGTLIWRFFSDFLRPEDHWLPPDNWQEQPNPGLARRTSPTNIGMALLSVMAAADLSLCPRGRAVELIANILDTTQGLEGWQGHLYNWYDTATLRPLSPRYVSTVDSGNLCACLIALREGLYQWGEVKLAQQADAISQKMRFAPLYDKERKLFFIGYSVEQEKMSQGWYDLMASEARQSSYIAVARGEVEPRHWRKLGRMLLGDNDYSGMASWTGTMFEYFMPNLLLPCEENSFLYESLAFCVYAQKRRGVRTKTPWGISESGFYAFDPGHNYQYKAHGVQALGLKRGLDSELVVAPYATFLAALIAPRSALRNLRRLRDLGLEGRYGLYEAVDYTPTRLGDGVDFEVVRSYMSHHLGMSLVAIDNVLSGNVMQTRFMADCDMSAYRELLQERVPVGAPILKQGEREVPEKPRPGNPPLLMGTGTQGDRLQPRCHLISNGSYCVFACDNGLTSAGMAGDQITLARLGEYYAPAGISAFFRSESGLQGLSYAPLYQEQGEYGWEFYSDGAAWNARWGELQSRMTISVPRRENGELRRVELNWTGAQPLEGELLLYFEPVLCPLRDYQAHPAFSRLFLQGERTRQGAVFCRRPRETEATLCLAVAWEAEGASACLDRANALGRGGLRGLAGRQGGALQGDVGTDPCFMVRFPVRLAPGERGVFSLALAAGDSVSAAAEGAGRILEGRGGEPGTLSALLPRLNLTPRQAQEGFLLLSRLAQREQGIARPPQSTLWAFGVSGDVPIALGKLQTAQDVEQAGVWCAWHQMINRMGWKFDLVLLLEEGGEYHRPLHTGLLEQIKGLGGETALGAKGGIHLLDSIAEGVLLPWTKVTLPLTPLEQSRAKDTAPAPPPVKLEAQPASWQAEVGGNMILQTGACLPPVGWSQVLCNQSFGWITDETGGGLLWSGGNAREHRLTPWANDPLAVGGAERVTLVQGGQEISVFADGDGRDCTVTYGVPFAKWEKQMEQGILTTVAFVHPEQNCRILRFTLSAGAGELRCRLGEGEAVTQQITADKPVSLITQPGEGTPVYHFSDKDDSELERESAQWWTRLTSSLTVTTPDKAFDRYLNGWCLYQVMACRLMARTSQYQNGGAYGFRDQLQDVAALLLTHPERTRAQLLLAASRQFEEGDVQHWWHPPHGAGVRTRITDDLLWLPWVLAQYVQTTGDYAILDEQVPYLSGRPLAPGEMERYEPAQPGSVSASMYQHACKAIECVNERGYGAHGLVLMGGGDWNDGMNRVGAKGRGESVWLSWFFALVLQDFAPVCRHVGQGELAQKLENLAQQCVQAAQGAWDGEWYRRGYYDDGTPLGSVHSRCCQIDSIAQSFSVLPGGADKARAGQAVTAALERLFDRERQVVRLFAPSFDGGGKDPGYIRSYPPGVRENGGQYTHASVWLALSCFRLGRTQEGWDILKTLLPEHHDTANYRAEPFVLSADVAHAPGREGQAGWSWYTGAAGWYYQVATEAMLGLRVQHGRLYLRPSLPPDWTGYQARWQLEKGVLHIDVKRTGTKSTLLDGQPADDGVALAGLEGEHQLQVTL